LLKLKKGKPGVEVKEKHSSAFFEIIQGRRSVRSFKPTPVPQEHILKILDAARLATTSGNQQPWQFLIVRDRGKLAQLEKESIARTLEMYREHYNLTPEKVEAQREKMTAYIEGFLSAPVYVIVLVDMASQYPSYNVHDGPLAAANLMLAARALGYGTVYGTDAVPEEAIRELFEIPERYKFICITPIGVPEAWPESPPKKELEEFIVYETFEKGE
jgi:nitroreductase